MNVSSSAKRKRWLVACGVSCAASIVALALAGYLAWRWLLGWVDSLWGPHWWQGPVVTAIGDVDGDGATEVAIGCFHRRRVWIVSVQSGAILRTHNGGEGFGWCALGMDDTDGDGVPDYWIGAPEARVATLFSGRDGQELRRIRHDKGDRWAGWDFEAMPDLDGDGASELAVGTLGRRDAGESPPAACTVFGSRDGATLWTLPVASDDLAYGATVLACPDRDRDGRGDMLVSGFDGREVSFLVVSGVNGSVIGHLAGAEGSCRWGSAAETRTQGTGRTPVAILLGNHFSECASLCALDDGRPLLALEPPLPSERFGTAVLVADDVDRDGEPELAVSAPGPMKGTGIPGGMPLPDSMRHPGQVDDPRGGRLGLYSGATGELLWVASGGEDWDWFGSSIALIDDVDGDELRDVAVTGERNFQKAKRRPFVRFLSGRTGRTIREIRLD